MLTPKPHLYTPAEYFALEAETAEKYEYYRGEIVAMAGASVNHNRIVGNIFSSLRNAVESKPCEAFFGDVRVWIEARDFFVYPDVMVVCGELQLVEGRNDTLTNPQVICEVLSESTEGYDRGNKFRAYWTLDSLKEYILIDQYRLRVDYFRQVSEKEWRLLVLSQPEENLTLESVGVELPLAEIYRNVAF